MLHGKQIICLSSINWDFNWQGHQEVMARFAAAGNTVLFIENTGVRTPKLRDVPRLRKRVQDWRRGTQGIRQVQENLYVCSPLVLPFPYSRMAQRINRRLFMRTIRRWAGIVGFERPILWTFLPTRFTLELIDELEPELVVYYCIADFEQLAPVKKVRRAEAELLQRADVVFAQGEVLAARCRRHHRHDVPIFPFGVNLERFLGGAQRPVPDDLLAIRSPRLGYVGALQRHVDGALLNALAVRHPEWNIVVVGPQVEEFTQALTAPNIHRLGSRPHEAIPRYVSGFDVCLIPYQLNDYTLTVFPTKLSEYLSLGKPVVSTPLPEVLAFNARHGAVVSIGRTYDEFERGIAEALREPADGQASRRVDVAREQSWAVRLDAMSRVMEERLQATGQSRSRQWSALLQIGSQRAIRRAAAIAVGLTLAYLAVFRTPAAWWLASPLVIAQPPQAADAIVVFAGGVGESGRAGQGYEERVEHAVRLYHEGYARHVIFSSGFTFTFQEADMMKALAISLGVPEEAIVLERQAANTVQNVRFTERLLAQHGWRRILLISSPYHMRRAQLIWRKQAPAVQVVYSPILHSRFYGRGPVLKLHQLQGILHEYLGICYYWLRGEV